MAIPDAVMAIKDGIFYNCTGLNCTGLTAVILGSGLEEIGVNAFEECTSPKQKRYPRP
jgi:hypothetical protein